MHNFVRTASKKFSPALRAAMNFSTGGINAFTNIIYVGDMPDHDPRFFFDNRVHFRSISPALPEDDNNKLLDDFHDFACRNRPEVSAVVCEDIAACFDYFEQGAEFLFDLAESSGRLRIITGYIDLVGHSKHMAVLSQKFRYGTHKITGTRAVMWYPMVIHHTAPRPSIPW